MVAGNLVAKPLDLRPVGDIGDVRRDAQPLRQSRGLAHPLRFPQAGGDAADIATFAVSPKPGGETSHIATLQASATNWRTSSRPMPLPPPVTTAVLPANSVMCTSVAFRGRSRYGPSPTSPPVGRAVRGSRGVNRLVAFAC